MIIIALSGKKHTGKNTVADIMLRNIDAVITASSFAYRVKAACAEYLGISDCSLEDNKDIYRDMLKKYAMFCRELFGNDVWIKVVDSELKCLQDDGVIDGLIITDLRFSSELEWAKSVGAIVIRVERDTGLVDSHISETNLDDVEFEHVIQNNGTLEELEQKVVELLDKLKIERK